MDYDFLIIGAGIAGLTCGLELLKRDKKRKICIIEQYDYVGGRMLTHKKDGYQWEIAAGRYSERHPMLLALIKHYGLHSIPIGNGAHNEFGALVPTFMDPLGSLSPQMLRTHTLGELLIKVHGAAAHDFIQLFPYWGEMWTLRADLGLKSFASEFRGAEEFFVCKEGLQSVTNGLKADYEALGGQFQLNTKVLDVKEVGDHVHLDLAKGSLTGAHCILTMPANPLRRLPSLRIPGLKHLGMEPLIRMYAIFPVKRGKSWFSDLGNVVFPDSVVRYFIPVNAAKGVCMISYTDGKDARHWIKMLDREGRPVVCRAVMKEIRRLFPDRHVPNLLDFYTYPWHDGCTYWLPGDYDPEKVCKEARHISKRISACGESFSLRQAWIEGSLESATELLKELPK